jgi:hypothetical protein
MLIRELLEIRQAKRDLRWLKEALRTAIQLEFFTIPPYLSAYWSIRAGGKDVSTRIRRIVKQEMLHMGLACNMLVALDPPTSSSAAFPPLAKRRFVPHYPSPLPGIGDGSLIVGLAPVSKELVEYVFMRIEYPQNGPIRAFSRMSATIGAFYEAIRKEFERKKPHIYPDRQLKDGSSGSIGLKVLDTLPKVLDAIDTIVGQGEGKTGTPCSEKATPNCPLAHYYQFMEIKDEKEYAWDGKKLNPTGKSVPFPSPNNIYPMEVIPCGGHPYNSKTIDGKPVPELRLFDKKYTEMLRNLQAAWQTHDQTMLDDAVTIMKDRNPGSLSDLARTLMSTPGKNGNYGPNFRVV